MVSVSARDTFLAVTVRCVLQAGLDWSVMPFAIAVSLALIGVNAMWLVCVFVGEILMAEIVLFAKGIGLVRIVQSFVTIRYLAIIRVFAVVMGSVFVTMLA